MSEHVLCCLVHERPEVVADLVSNLRAFEPSATLLVYDGSPRGRLLDGLGHALDGRVLVHPSPRPMRWGRLHDFAIDSMRFALQELDFDALTIVDSDQLLIRRGYGKRVTTFLNRHPKVGMLGNAPSVQPRESRVDPVRVAWREPDLWRPFLDKLPGGSAAFPHWTFWPSTVFTRQAAADLVALFDDPELPGILRRTRMFATEEIVLPTLVAALGYEIARHPASYDYVRYRVSYDALDVDAALANPAAYWMHPVPRRLDDPVRSRIRELTPARRANRFTTVAPARAREATAAVRLDDRQGLVGLAASMDLAIHTLAPGERLSVDVASEPAEHVVAVARALAATRGADVRQAGREVTVRVPEAAATSTGASHLGDLAQATSRMARIEGWFEPEEGVLLAATAAAAVRSVAASSIVEIGSFCGRATTVLGSVARHAPGAKVFAVDRFDGVVGEVGRTFRCGPTLDRFTAAVVRSRLTETVRAVVGTPSQVAWSTPIALLLVDGLHDYRSVEADFRHFEPWLENTGFVAFHDYTTYPGVRRFVDDLIRSGRYGETARLGSLIVLRPRSATVSVARPPIPALPSRGAHHPLVSCLMPTFNRREYVPSAIERFLAQDYPRKELLVIDDGTDPVEDLVPVDPRIRYVRPGVRMTIGAKRNLAAELAHGEVLANWDDDDWVASWRLSYQVDALLGSDAEVVGLSTLLYLEPSSGRAWRYAYPSDHAPWVHDPTFCIRRSTWEADRFPDANYGLDTAYLSRGRRKRVAALANERFYIGMIHAENTSRKDTRGGRWRPTSADELRAMMAADGTAA